MADVKHIMVVDDHFEMLEFLRSMLELSDHEYEVLAVPSAEECMLELRRSHFDLLITDVRLPGMSGFDLVRRMRKLGRDMPVIMITAYSSPQGKKEAADLGVLRYFRKPLDTDEVLTAVNTALYGEKETVQIRPSSTEQPANLSQAARSRLELLRADTGAMHLTLTTAQGQTILTLGHIHRKYNLDGLAQLLTQNMINSFHLADQIGSRKPYTFQYHLGDDVELYCASVGREYYLTMFFDARSRRGRIGTIWVFTQRATKDLLEMLSGGHLFAAHLPMAVPQPEDTAAVAETPLPLAEPALEEPDPTYLNEGRVSPTAIKERLPRDAKQEAAADPLPAPPLPVDENETPLPAAEIIDIAPDELKDLLAGKDPGETEESLDLDAFWDSALSEDDMNDLSAGLSFEEAMQRGLISIDTDEEEA